MLAAALVVAASAIGVIPFGVADLIARALPALLVVAGVWFILRDRMPFAGAIALGLSAVLVIGMAYASYTSRSAQVRTDNRVGVLETISPNVTLLRINIATLGTDVELLSAFTRDAGITGEFVGSIASTIEVNYTEAVDDTATLIVNETQAGGFPRLDEVGRGTFRLELPPDLPIDIQFTGGNGDLILNMGSLALERLNLESGRGDVVVSMPAYDPLFSQPEDMLGEIIVRQGDLTMFIPPAVAARLELNREGSGIEPQYDASVYNYLVGDVLEARDIIGADMVIRYTLTVPRGLIRVEVSA
jgi:hypothetical protein